MEYIKQAFGNVLKSVPQNKREYAAKQLQIVLNKVKYLNEQVERQISVKTGIRANQREVATETYIDILILHGYSEVVSNTMPDDFLNFMLNNAMTSNNYNPTEITQTILNSLRISYYSFSLEFGKEPTDYNTLREFMITEIGKH